ncbi:hypothetical protein J5474_03015 [Sagittula sp. M10.9X]|uniref:Succinate dehydrogenase n=1 Tax=Sagittula salina TaxID=2820268 RepID=A0A940RZT6_9RHOB|nr:hypothetical protein [Sagittula salina]
MRLALLAPLLFAAVAACSPQVQDQIAREAARSTVARVVTQQLPGVPVQPAIDCVIDNATAAQIYALGADTLGGPTQSSVEIVAQIASQPQTVQCLATRGLPALMQGQTAGRAG